MKMKTLQDLFLDQLRDLYHAENQLVKALPKMAKGAHAPALRSAFEEHLEQTRHQAERLEQVFEKLGARAKGKKCQAMVGLVEEGEELLGEDAEPDVRDAGLIAAAQKAEHYEIACYGTLCTWAQELGQQGAFDLLKQTLDEEKATDEKLTHLAESGINQAALAGAHA
jgi:ferritin-like metal-binding protein YciE